MKLSREALHHSYKRAKSFVSSAWDKTKYAFDTADKLATLTAHGMLALGDRVDPQCERADREGSAAVFECQPEVQEPSQQCGQGAGCYKKCGLRFVMVFMIFVFIIFDLFL